MMDDEYEYENEPGYNNVINYPFIDYIIKSYVPELDKEKSGKYLNMELFKESMLHDSTRYRDNDKTYERLEFLGDAFFHLAITEYLYKRYEDENEGFLTRLRIRIERGDSMAELTKQLELDRYIQLYETSVNDHILEDVFEAFIGAFYLSFGFKYSNQFIVKLIERHKDLSEMIFHDDNYKDLLLRYYHQMKWGHPKYEEDQTNTKNNNQSKHNNKRFVSIVRDPYGRILGKGTATSKKKAEQNASENALVSLGVIVDNEIDPNWIDKLEKSDEKSDNKMEKEKKDKKSLSVFNPGNTLIDKSIVKDLLVGYNVPFKRDTKIDIKMFHEAMTHRSYLTRRTLTEDDKKAAVGCVKLQKKSNERLEFLGDAIIHFVIAEFLYHMYPDADEGFLTRLRCKLENRDSLFHLAKCTNIGSYVLVSQTIEVLHGRNNVNIIGSAFESFVGVVYLQLGFKIAKQFILEVIRVEYDVKAIAESETNYKDLVLQLYNKNGWGHPVYKVIKEDGPDHCKMFTVGIYLKNKLKGQGTGSSKKKAEQIASKEMYDGVVKTV